MSCRLQQSCTIHASCCILHAVQLRLLKRWSCTHLWQTQQVPSAEEVLSSAQARVSQSCTRQAQTPQAHPPVGCCTPTTPWQQADTLGLVQPSLNGTCTPISCCLTPHVTH